MREKRWVFKSPFLAPSPLGDLGGRQEGRLPRRAEWIEADLGESETWVWPQFTVLKQV